MIVTTGTCMLCGEPGVLVIEDEKLARRAIAWRRQPTMLRPFVQNALPELTPGQREQLMNGTHETCFDRAFGAGEE